VLTIGTPPITVPRMRAFEAIEFLFLWSATTRCRLNCGNLVVNPVVATNDFFLAFYFTLNHHSGNLIEGTARCFIPEVRL
jgi:hypothetical protein